MLPGRALARAISEHQPAQAFLAAPVAMRTKLAGPADCAAIEKRPDRDQSDLAASGAHGIATPAGFKFGVAWDIARHQRKDRPEPHQLEHVIIDGFAKTFVRPDA